MPSETFHATHQGSKPGEQVTESGLVLPAGVGRERNLRGVPISFGDLDGSPVEQGSPESDIESTLTPEAVQTEDVLEEAINDQPRRIRNELNGNGREKLVKHEDGSFEWVPLDPSERRSDVNSEVLEQVVGGMDSLEAAKERHDQEMAALQDEVAELKKQLAELKGESEVEPEVTAETDSESELDNEAAIDSEETVEIEEQQAQGEYPIEPNEGLMAEVAKARNNYAELTAKHRASSVGHFLHNSKFLAKIPALVRLSDWANEKNGKELNEAREEYKSAVVALQQDIISAKLETYGDSEEVLRSAKRAAGEAAIGNEMKLEVMIAVERMDNSGDSNKFIDWWVRQEGFKGKLKKAALLAGGGLTVGVLAGLASAPAFGVAVGAAAGAGIGAWVNKKRASGTTERYGDTSTIVAEKQKNEDALAKQEYANEQFDSDDGYVSIDQLTKLTDERTANEKVANRARIRSSAGAVAAGASAGAIIEGISEGIVNGINSQPQATGRVAGEFTPQAPATPEMAGTSFDIQSGSSFTQELMEFAGANGHVLSPDQSYSLHNELLQNFGNYIQDGAGNAINTYTEGGEIRIGGPGGGQWAPGVSEYIQNWMTTRGL